MMNQSKLKKFAIESRKKLIRITSDKINQLITLGDDKAAAQGIQSQYSSLQSKLKEVGNQQLAEQVAYVWFNRFIALRFMDANNYNHPKILTPGSGQSSVPQILNDAINGIVSNDLKLTQQDVLTTLSDSSGGKDPQGLAYRQLLIASCNKLSSDMPDMFERISDYTELLLPDDLLSVHSIISEIRDSITDDDCKDVEIIGWLYQYYISERKDEVFAGFKKNKKAEAKDIPAATQLFTPHWIVRYLVENSLGRLWMLNNPNSKLPDKMPYYIAPEMPETDHLRISSPTEIKICDPACGSGHMLTYAFDLLCEIYNEAGYSPTEIPMLILQNNLYGVEIDQRAGSLASFALAMKAKSYNNQVDIDKLQPHICVLQNIRFTDQEITDYTSAAGTNLFTSQLQSNINAFAEADNFGSLITTSISNTKEITEELESINLRENLLLSHTHKKVLRVLEQSDYLCQKYHVVVANPPYMGGSNMNARLNQYAKDYYLDSKSDLFAMFIERCSELVMNKGYYGMITMHSWMFLSSFEILRKNIIKNKTIISMAHLGSKAFEGMGGEVVQTASFVIKKQAPTNYSGNYIRLVSFDNTSSKEFNYINSINSKNELFYTSNQNRYQDIPGQPIAYWISDHANQIFLNSPKLGQLCISKTGMTTGDNDFFLRYWFEIPKNLITHKYYFYNKGGGYRKWYGNINMVIDWANDGAIVKGSKKSTIRNPSFYFKKCISWNLITTDKISVRDLQPVFVMGDAGPACYVSNGKEKYYLALLNSCVSDYLLKIINPTINYSCGVMEVFPVIESKTYEHEIIRLAEENIITCKDDWDSYENSWEFNRHPLVSSAGSIKKAFESWRDLKEKRFIQLKSNEEKLNCLFIEIYRLENELTPEVESRDVTIQKADITQDILSFISYAIGCMFGRYSIDKPGLILANQGDDLEAYKKLVLNSRFMADDDGILPVLGDSWFEDDITERLKQFVKVTFGDEKCDENIQFIEQSIGKDLRSYLLKDFYPEHVRHYKKRPIYWLFTSPKGNFNALVYIHRYRPDTLSTMRNNYLQPFIAKLEDKKSHYENTLPSANNDLEKIKLQKDIEKIRAMLVDLNEYEKTLTDFASRKIVIDLDDGVKVNYAKFEGAIAKVVGL